MDVNFPFFRLVGQKTLLGWSLEIWEEGVNYTVSCTEGVGHLLA